MERINTIVVDSSKAVSSGIKNYFEGHNNINIVGTFADGEEALCYIINNTADVDLIIMDLILPKMDGISLLHNLEKRKINKKIVILSSYLNEDISKQVSEIGVDFYMLKPFNLESLENRIIDLYRNYEYNSSKLGDIELGVSEILHNLGIPSHIRGYQYIREGVMYLYNRNSYVSYITKEIYPDIANKYDTTSSRVERAIRHAIEISWERGDLDLIEDLFGHSIEFNRSKPTNSEYINTIADRIKLNDKVGM